MKRFLYIHKDGRRAEHEEGTWYAIREALGEKEASEVVEASETVRWIPTRDIEGYYRKADLFVGEQQVGTFFN